MNDDNQVDRLHLKLHPIVYRNKTYSAREFGLRLRKDVVKDLLSQVDRHNIEERERERESEGV